jgi:hypothetical protein
MPSPLALAVVLALVAGLGQAGPLPVPLVTGHLVAGAAGFSDPVLAAGWLLTPAAGAGQYCFYAWKGSGTTARGLGDMEPLLFSGQLGEL